METAWKGNGYHRSVRGGARLQICGLGSAPEKRRESKQRYLVEKSPKSFKKLQVIAVKTKGIQIIPIKGKFEDNIDQILDYIPADAFCLTFVDPKGWTQYPFSKVGSIIERKPGEVLINFMYDFINRATNIEDPRIRKRLDLLFASTHWKKRITTDLSKTERETAIVNEFMETLKRVGNYPFALSTPVKKRGKNRTLYHLVYGTAHERGIEVFRDPERLGLKKEFVTQATIKHEIAETKSKTRDLFSVDDLPLEEDLMRFIRDQKEQAKQYVLKILHKNRSVTFETIWIQVLQRIPLRLTELKDVLVEMSKEGLVLLEFEEPRQRKPKNNTLVQLPN